MCAFVARYIVTLIQATVVASSVVSIPVPAYMHARAADLRDNFENCYMELLSTGLFVQMNCFLHVQNTTSHSTDAKDIMGF